MMHHVLRNWFEDENHCISSIPIGLLNETFIVENLKGRFILQKVNPIFSPEVNLDIDALTSYIEKKGLKTPRLIGTKTGGLWCVLGEHCWRLLTFMEGENFSALKNPEHAEQAGRIVGAFHRALADFKYSYRVTRPNVHDTKVHLSKLERVLKSHSDHAFAAKVVPLAERILLEAQGLNDLSRLPKRHSHGDLKINNLLFSRTGAHSLIDLDTVGLLAWPIEMGDAFRSWCNPKGEDVAQAIFDEKLFEAAISAYAKVTSDLWTIDEVQMLLDALRTIPLELSSRFLRDVLEDSYFGYDSASFSSRSAHNLVRARGQFSLYCAIESKKAQLEQIIRRAFS